ncbi:hypothetical protein ACFC4G_01880 [Streptomyces sp. NPDC056002]|uniref:hypothetical protein n=1 Tax=Streptomyces sp. NPDC056002 TaxID=3345675 RepID=UPI0035D9FF43
MERRGFAAGIAAAAAAALLGAAPVPSHGDDRLRKAMRDALGDALDDRATARAVEPHVHDIGFDRHPPTAALDRIDFLVAHGFGNRPPAGGGDPTKVMYEPGPVNGELADTVARVRARRDVPVYAQWEIARFLKSEYGMTRVTSIEPVVAPDGALAYLSTDGVAARVVEIREKLPEGIGTAGVIGFRDHVKRCVQTTNDRGMTTYAPAGFEMPGTYDPSRARPGRCGATSVWCTT